jgi:RND family efflux transporter MFP subunit
VVLAALGQTACSSSHTSEPAVTREAVTVQVEQVRSDAAGSVVDVGGIVQPRTSALVTSRLMAPVREVRVAPGDRVRQGQVLVTLDARDLQAQARQAATGETAAQQGRAALDAERQAAVAALDLARASHGRMSALHARKSATQQELDEATAGLRAAEARVAAIDARARQADAAIGSAQAGRDVAAVTASYATITAPFAGIVTEKLIEPGNMAAPGTPLVRIEDARGYTLDVRLDAANVTGLSVGDAIDVVIDADRPIAMAGRVRELARAMQADGRAFLVRIDLPEDEALRAGMFGRARLPGQKMDAITVPSTAVQRRGQVVSVFVVEGDVARRRMVVLGAALPGDRHEVLSGLSDGERVVTAAPATLEDGAPVRAGAQ